jgi:esterase FrsA
VNDIGELKEYVRVHAKGQRIPRYQEILDRIRTDDGSGPGSWVGEWCAAGADLQRQGRHVDAVRRFALARFPFVDGPARADAAARCVAAVERWRADVPGVEPLTVELKDGTVKAWTYGLSTTDPKPLFLVMGGIVSVKEQWAPMLAHARRLGLAVVVTEMPSVGENTVPYGPDAWRMISGLLDELADRADVGRTYATALSFSGHLALRAAVDDARIRAVITVGAPVGRFFTDVEWQRGLPAVTLDTLGHLIGAPAAAIPGTLAERALAVEQLEALEIPVYYVASRRDEIVPYAETELLRAGVRRLELLVHDDVHASPSHVLPTQLWTTRALLRARGVRTAQTGLLSLLLRFAR